MMIGGLATGVARDFDLRNIGHEFARMCINFWGRENE